MAGTSSINLADVSQFLVGSDTLKLTPFFIKSFTIPSIAFSHPELGSRNGTKIHLGADSIDFNDLSFEVMLDSGFETYFELLDISMQEVDFEHGSFAMPEFDLWVQVLKPNGDVLFRVDFRNCRISSLGEIALDPNSELGASIQLSLVYDYFEYTRIKCESSKDPESQESQEVCVTGPARWYDNIKVNK